MESTTLKRLRCEEGITDPEHFGVCDDPVCECGNTVNKSGFFPCDHLGNQVEPTQESWPGDLVKCAGCGTVYVQETFIEYCK